MKAPLYCPFPGCKIKHPDSYGETSDSEWVIQHWGKDHHAMISAQSRATAEQDWMDWVALSNPKHGA